MEHTTIYRSLGSSHLNILVFRISEISVNWDTRGMQIIYILVEGTIGRLQDHNPMEKGIQIPLECRLQWQERLIYGQQISDILFEFLVMMISGASLWFGCENRAPSIRQKKRLGVWRNSDLYTVHVSVATKKMIQFVGCHSHTSLYYEGHDSEKKILKTMMK